MIHPPFLKPGSIIGITCPSSYIAPEKVTNCIDVLNRWGFMVKQGNTIGTNYHYFSGTDEERLSDLQVLLDDPEVDAILMGRGGYGMVRIIDDLDFTQFKKKPKWICGFSDITVLHNHIEQNFGIATLHSPMCGAFKTETENEAYLKTFYAAITGESIYYHTPHSQYNRKGESQATLTGGNLSLLAHIVGSPSEINTAGKILFIEDIEEYLYKMDRMLLTLKRAGKFDNLKGLVVGYMTNMLDTERPFGQTIEEIIWDKVKEYDYPICFNFQCGHEDINHTLTMGAMHTLKVTDNGGVLELKRVL
ncbi:MAG: peptidase LD-carboxypeptidase [Flavipsychrobacter sp.]|jgi:muramoyltetrapeptide carboxypeptidase|nr:peptidase LD-carboxypeptidase [Flavipsychrobacter sp.]